MTINRTCYRASRRVTGWEGIRTDTVASGPLPQSGKGRRWQRRPDPLLRCGHHPDRPVHGEGVTVVHESTHAAPGCPSSPADAVPTSVYRYYDRDGALIYVGVTGRGARRNYEHNTSKDWWSFVARQEVDHYATRPEALRRERALIIRHRPPFNRQHNPDADGMRAIYLAYATAPAAVADPFEAWLAARKRITFTVHSVDTGHRKLTLKNELGSAPLAPYIRAGDEFPVFQIKHPGLNCGGVRLAGSAMEGETYFITLQFERFVPLFKSAFAKVRIVKQKAPPVFRIATLHCTWETYRTAEADPMAVA